MDIKELKKSINSLVEDNRQVLEDASSEYDRLKKEYQKKLSKYKDSTCHEKEKDKWIPRRYYEKIEEEGSLTLAGITGKSVFVPPDFPDDPDGWFDLYDISEKHPFYGYISGKPNKADITLCSKIVVAVLYNQFLPNQYKHESIGNGKLDGILIEINENTEEEIYRAIKSTNKTEIITLEVQLKDFNNGGSKRLLLELMVSLSGVVYNERNHGKSKQPDKLKEILKSKGYDEIANAISTTKGTIALKENHRIVSK